MNDPSTLGLPKELVPVVPQPSAFDFDQGQKPGREVGRELTVPPPVYRHQRSSELNGEQELGGLNLALQASPDSGKWALDPEFWIGTPQHPTTAPSLSGQSRLGMAAAKRPPREFPHLYVRDSGGSVIINPQTTIDPELQRGLLKFIRQHGSPTAAVAMISARTGEVLVAIGGPGIPGDQEDQEGRGDRPDLPLVIAPDYPAASMFKIVVAAAAYEKGALAATLGQAMALGRGCSTDGPPAIWLADSEARTGVPLPATSGTSDSGGGGPGSLGTTGKKAAQSKKPKKPIKKGGRHRGGRRPAAGDLSITVGPAFGRSCNAFFAKLAGNTLGLDTVLDYSEIFGWGERGAANIKADFRMPVNEITPPELEGDVRALKSRAAAGKFGAGFGKVGVSAMHAAWISLLIANDGAPRDIHLFRSSRDDGSLASGLISKVALPLVQPQPLIGRDTARWLRGLMGWTVREGTASNVYSREAYSAIKDDVGGKTGTLKTFGGKGTVTWFTGIMPLSDPDVVVAALVVETGSVQIKGKDLAAEALRLFHLQQTHASLVSVKRP